MSQKRTVQKRLDADPALLEDLVWLKNQVREAGLHRKTPGRILLGWAYNISLAMAGLSVFIVVDNLLIQVPALLVSTLGLLGIATNAHTASHGGVTDGGALDRFLFHLGFPFFLMVSARYWHHSHIMVHHANPNVIGVDYDNDLMPYFALNEDDIRDSGPAARFYYRNLQGFLFPFALAVNGFNVQRAGWLYLLRELFDRHRRSAATWWDLVAMLSHVLVWIVAPMFFFPLTAVLSLYALRIALMGYAMFAAFAPGHFPLATAAFDRSALTNGRTDFYLRNAAATMNFKTGFFGTMACNGVQFQVEHHFLPKISHFQYRKVSGYVREFCRRRGYPYHQTTWFRAIWMSYVALFSLKKSGVDAEAFRSKSAYAG